MLPVFSAGVARAAAEMDPIAIGDVTNIPASFRQTSRRRPNPICGI
jgi:hypothetical protein